VEFFVRSSIPQLDNNTKVFVPIGDLHTTKFLKTYLEYAN